MLTGSRIWTLAVVMGLCVLATAGCRRKSSGDTIINGSDIFTTDSFPGSSVGDGDVADDGRGMNPSAGQASGLRVVFNGDRDTAMLTYTLTGGAFFGSGGSDLYAHYYDGGTWTPPVALHAVDHQSQTASNSDVIVAFLNTDNHASSAAQDRNGDAIIFWRATDIDGPTAADDPNICLYSTYFDVSFVDSPSHRYGFQEFSDRLNSRDEASEDVTTIGVVSDGLCGEADWQDGSNSYSWGNDTTSIVVVWHQQENNDGVAGSGFEDRSIHAVRFDPAETIADDLPLTPSFDTRLAVNGMGASDSGTSSEETQVYYDFITYNNCLIFKCAARNDTAGDDNPGLPGWVFVPIQVDVTIQVTAINLDTGALFAPSEILNATPSTADTVGNNMEFVMTNGGFQNRNSVYGSDEGLSCLVVYNLQEQQLIDPFINSGSLAIAELDEATGTVLEVDEISTDQALIVDTVQPGEIDIRMSRNGDYIWAVWRQVLDTAGFDNQALWANQYATTRIQDDGTFPVPDLLANTTSGAGVINVDVDGEDVTWFAFQQDLGYVCGAQSDPAVMNVFFEQSSGTFDEVDRTELTSDVDVPGVFATFAVTICDVGENGDLTSFGPIVNNNHGNFVGTDGGHNGDPIYFYIHDVDGTATDDFRLFAERDGTVFPGLAEVDSFVSFRQTFQQNLTCVATPAGSDTNYYDPADAQYGNGAAHANEFVHILSFEPAVHENDGNVPEIRTRQFNCADNGDVFTESFRPSVGALFQDPFQISLSDVSNAFGPFAFAFARSDNTVGVWFGESSHLYYQECNADSDNVGWRVVDEDAGDLTPIGDPALVDDWGTDDTSTSTFGFSSVVGFATRSCTCDTLGSAMVFWNQADAGISDNRLHVRVRD